VRLIGVGETRPVFVLAENTPGYQHGIGRRRRVPIDERCSSSPTTTSTR